MTILDDIVAVKKEKLLAYPKEEQLITRKKPKDFKGRLQAEDGIALIGEVKRASPSQGDINAVMDPLKQAEAYMKGGADAISVLTEHHFFKGSFSDLEEISKIADVPLLNKDFIIDKRQINRAYNHGADIILLIVTILDDAALLDLYQYADSLGLNIIVEVHNEDELKRALKISPVIIGINNRDLKTFTVDISNTENLLKKYGSQDIHFIAESGIHSAADAQRMKAAGASGMLVGESLMRSDSIEEKIKELKLGDTNEG
ncbi:Indole-3-glycerol phosphate synthase [Jeotgalicoccus aerolatus]|uniref:Indole-3-glycerol phosphate synthase n=1 Tax=Jeotgalicoccus aerolatus TaxID=709510 RepID=A0ABS4HJY9_9STAP|nr:indole-3-glycerol phosphate synthase TrpC [Jeotgalicoccus aerolatus]MBP1951240.1 indole-3-glycerol phosphate synthase [Jeotgalicoccus aerolatus]GGD99055.1 indole-3-glycerol phosphate synthase [Jeotgalicoccus aerolatus]CAD2077500.1 Indole-3-glycerol phosphate synthase [Jeotgalicoccus aerolatus]